MLPKNSSGTTMFGQNGMLVFFAVVFGGFLSGIVAIVLAVSTLIDRWWPLALVPVCMFLGGAFWYIGRVEFLKARVVPKITVTPLILKPEGTCTITCDHVFGSLVHIRELAVRLVVRESQLHDGDDGSDWRKWQEQVVSEAILPSGTYEKGARFMQALTFQVPKDARLSYQVPRNAPSSVRYSSKELSWFIGIYLELSDEKHQQRRKFTEELGRKLSQKSGRAGLDSSPDSDLFPFFPFSGRLTREVEVQVQTNS